MNRPVPRYMPALVAGLLLLAIACSSFFRPGRVNFPGTLTLEAQTLPLTKTLVWDAATNADSYIVTQDAVQIGTPTGQSLPITIAALGAHTFTVVAVNLWGTSPPATLTVNVVSPGSSGNVRIR